MRYIIFFLLIALTVFAAHAQGVPMIGPSVSFGVHGNLGLISLPGPEVNGSTPLDEVYGLGYGGGVHFDVEFVSVTLRVSADYTTFSPDDANYQKALAGLAGSAASDFTIEGGRINIVSANVNGTLPILPLPFVSPYITAGVGLARIDADAAEISFQGAPSATYPGFSSGTSTAINAGAGVDLDLFLSLFVEAKYTWIFAEGQTTNFVPISLGINF